MSESMGEMTFHHQDGDLVFAVADALFAVDGEGRFTLSVRCEENPAAHWMSQPGVCVVDAQLPGPLAPGLVVRHNHNDESGDASPHAHVYVGFHAEPEDMAVTFVRENDGAWEIALSFVMEDVKYYSSRARNNQVVCRCRAMSGSTEAMWIPA